MALTALNRYYVLKAQIIFRSDTMVYKCKTNITLEISEVTNGSRFRQPIKFDIDIVLKDLKFEI